MCTFEHCWLLSTDAHIFGTFAQLGFGPAVSQRQAHLAAFATPPLATMFADLMCVVLFVISAIVLFGVTLPALDCLCSQECRQNNDINSDDPDDKEDIDDVCGRQDELRQLYLVGFGIGLVMAILQCAGVVYGRELAQHSYFVSNHAAAPGTAFVPTAQPVQVQAQRAQPTAQGSGGYNPQPAAQATSYGQHAPLYDAPGAGYPQHGGYNQSGGYPQQGGYPKTAS